MNFINDNFDRVSPYPFLAWFAIGMIFIALTHVGLPMDFIEANSTFLNISYGVFISTILMLVCCVLLYFDKTNTTYLSRIHSLSRLFSDTAMGAAGFIVTSTVYQQDYAAAAGLSLGFAVYTLTGNHLYHVIFNENKGSRKLFRDIDEKSNTRVGKGLIERDIERKVVAFVSLIIAIASLGLGFTFYYIRH
jgi:hypothetical protein